MKRQEIVLRAYAKKISWIEAAEIVGQSAASEKPPAADPFNAHVPFALDGFSAIRHGA